jgi:hypothetical protein
MPFWKAIRYGAKLGDMAVAESLAILPSRTIVYAVLYETISITEEARPALHPDQGTGQL